MSEVFKTVLSMSIGASVLAVLVLIARAIIGRRQTLVLTILFAMLIAKLIVPLSIESNASILNILPTSFAQTAQVEELALPIADDAIVSQEREADEAQMLLQPGNMAGQMIESADGDAETQPVPLVANDTMPLSAAVNREPMTPMGIAAIVWLFGMAAMAAIIAASNIAFMRKVRKNRAYDAPGFDDMVRQCAREFGIRQKIRAVRMSDVNTVAVCGIFRPKLLIAPETFAALCRAEQRHVIMHELSHIKRKDTLVCLIITMVNVVHWFNPFVWIAFAIFRKDLEVMCDAKVLRKMAAGERHGYANTLVTLAQKAGKRNSHLAMALFMSKASIKRRIAMIAKYKANKPLVVALALVLAVGVAITGCTTGVSDIEENGEMEAEQTMNEDRAQLVPANQETATTTVTVSKLGTYSIDFSFCADDKNIVSNIVKTMEVLEGKVFSPGMQETLLSSEVYNEDGWETAAARSWQDIGGLEPINIRHIEYLDTQLQRGGGSEIVLAAVKGAAIEAGLSVTSLDPGEGILNENLVDVTLSIILRDNSIYAVFYAQERTEQTQGGLGRVYSADLVADNLRIIADAQVIFPDTDDVPIYSVSAADFSQVQVDGLMNALFDGETIYELEWGPVFTKARAKEILDVWKQRKAATSGEWATEENQAWCDRVIAEWEQKYLTAPEENNAIVSDGKLKPRDLINSETGEKAATYHELIVFTGETSDKETGMLIRNNNDLQEAIGHAEGYGISLERNANATYSIYNDYNDNYWMSAPTPVTRDTVITDENVREKLKTTPEQAQNMTGIVLQKAGIDYMALYSMSLVDNANNGSVDGEVTSATHYAYRLQFVREVEGIPCIYKEGGTGFAEFWAYETLDVFIDDRGIFLLDWSSPLVVNGYAATNAQMLPIDSAIYKFENSMRAKYGAIESVQTTIKVQRVVLELIRVANFNSIDNGMLVPVWNFYGTRTIGNDNAEQNTEDEQIPVSLLMINAVDGSIISP